MKNPKENSGLVFFLGEAMVRDKDYYHYWSPSAAFLKKTFACENTVFLSPVSPVEKPRETSSSQIHSSEVIPLPFYSSNKQFLLNFLFNPFFGVRFCCATLKAAKEFRSRIFWVRGPSLGSLIFANLILISGNRVCLHLCADFRSSWRSQGLSFWGRSSRRLGALLVHFLIQRIVRSSATLIVFVTGTSLYGYVDNIKNGKAKYLVDVLGPEKLFNDRMDKDNRKRPFQVLFVGRIREDKGIFDLIGAAKILRSMVELRIVGEGEDSARLARAIQRAGMGTAVELLGQKSSAEIFSIMKDCDVLVVPSKNKYEGFPRVIYEAWMSGIPVITSNLPGIIGVVENNKNGQILDDISEHSLAKCLAFLIKNPDHFNALKSGAIEMGGRYGEKYWINNVQDALKSYEESR